MKHRKKKNCFWTCLATLLNSASKSPSSSLFLELEASSKRAKRKLRNESKQQSQKEKGIWRPLRAQRPRRAHGGRGVCQTEAAACVKRRKWRASNGGRGGHTEAAACVKRRPRRASGSGSVYYLWRTRHFVRVRIRLLLLAGAPSGPGSVWY